MEIVGAVVSTVNAVSVKAPPADWPAPSTKLTMQSVYVPSASVLCTVMVCSPLDPMLVGVAEEHDPPYVAVPVSLTVILKLGVASFVLEETCCETESVGAVVSTVKLVRDCAPLDAALPAVSAKLTVQSAYVPSLRVPIVRVFVPLLRLVGVEAAQDPEKEAVPASLTVTVYCGVLSVVGVEIWAEMEIVGAIVSTENV